MPIDTELELIATKSLLTAPIEPEFLTLIETELCALMEIKEIRLIITLIHITNTNLLMIANYLISEFLD